MGGVGSARNIGISIAKGEYLGFVDGDDTIQENMYELLLCSLKNFNADLCICRNAAYTEEGTLVRQSSLFSNTSVMTKDEMLELLALNSEPKFVVPYNKLYKSYLFENVRYPEETIIDDEFVIHHIYGKCNRIICINNILYNYLIRNGSLIHRKVTIRNLDAVNAFLDRTAYYFSIHKNRFAYLTLRHAIHVYCEIYYAIKNKTKKDKYILREQKNKILEQAKLCSKMKLTMTECVELEMFKLSTVSYWFFRRIVHLFMK